MSLREGENPGEASPRSPQMFDLMTTMDVTGNQASMRYRSFSKAS